MMISKASSPRIKRAHFLILIPAIALFLLLFGNLEAHDSGTGFSLPLHVGHISSGYGDRIHPFTGNKVFHRGIDIAAPKGVPVYAAAEGIVVETGHHEKSGNYIIIAHADSFATFYSQLAEILVDRDSTVFSGTIIGRVGSSGLSTGPHLHFEIRDRNEFIDPETLIDFSSLAD